jgi:putative transposase
MVQQQALRDFATAMAAFFDPHNPARRPTWRKAGRNEGFRIVAVKPGHVRRLNRKAGEVWVPKGGWVRFRWSRPVPLGARSYRVTMDRAGRWHVAFAAIPEPVPAPGNGQTVGVDRGVTVSAALSTGELLRVPGLSTWERARLRQLERKLARAQRGSGRSQRVKAATGLNRGIMRSGWGLLVRRLADKAPSRVEKVSPAYTSQRCSACGYVAAESRKSQALFDCVACGFACNADVNAARNIAAGHAVTARGGDGVARPVNREPQLLLQSA